MSELQPVRGTHDLLFADMKRYRHVVDTALKLSARFGFEEIKTPIFEFTPVFSRTLGDTSDIVSKEMYTFTDKGGESLSLRPEGTAGVMRAFISEGLANRTPLKLFYEGPMFRYERPQKGRYRQFYQIGVELIGTESSDADLEVMSIAQHLFNELKISDKINLEINSIGDKESRSKYRAVLVEYYKKHESSLSEDSKRRLQTNPMRILDSKDRNDITINKEAPKLLDHLNDLSKTKFDFIQNELTKLGLKYTINQQLVRGLDYYSHLVFEFKTQALGSQDAVLSGGRYDGLAETMGGGKTPAVGWAAGIERLSLLLPDEPKSLRPVTLIPLGEPAESYARALAHELRGLGFYIDMSYAGNMSNRMKKAATRNALAAIIIGEDELKSNELAIKNFDSGLQVKVSRKDLETFLQKLFS